MIDTVREAFLYALAQWAGLGVAIFAVVYYAVRLAIKHERRTATGG